MSAPVRSFSGIFRRKYMGFRCFFKCSLAFSFRYLLFDKGVKLSALKVGATRCDSIQLAVGSRRKSHLLFEKAAKIGVVFNANRRGYLTEGFVGEGEQLLRQL